MMEIDEGSSLGWASLLYIVARRFEEPLEAQKRRPFWARAADRLVQIGDFITAAVWLGMLDKVVWIRSDFPSRWTTTYNGPAPGRYRVELDWNLENELEIGALPKLCFRILEVLEAFDQPPLRGHSVESDFDSCSDFVRRGPSPRLFELTVGTAEQILSLMSRPFPGSEHPPASERRRWILDVDLDFFASYDPPFEHMVSSGLSERLVRELSFLLPTNGTCSSGASGAGQSLIRAAIVGALRELPRLLSGAAEGAVGPSTEEATSVRNAVQAFSPLTRSCDFGEDRSVALYRMAAGLRPAEKSAWRRAFDYSAIDVIAEDFGQSLFMSAPGPHYASFAEVQRGLDNFARLINLTALVPRSKADGLQLGGEMAPYVITIARSMAIDRYLPSHLWRATEDGVLTVLEAALGPLEVRHKAGLRALHEAT
eukprot:TRINITY_DN24483_c0_g1_i1.p1 TRINITY_DN24483_c0_g1~~TRINITY_DN24483_c0_g1_i1.p1  ORF type:complete len:426 (+),score=71.21 TRINITY_DN24483_c0_g1_i1:316-1593(+)